LTSNSSAKPAKHFKRKPSGGNDEASTSGDERKPGLGSRMAAVNSRKPENEKDSDTIALERTLADALGLDVKIAHKGNGGHIRINYRSLEQLEAVCRLLEQK